MNIPHIYAVNWARSVHLTYKHVFTIVCLVPACVTVVLSPF